jgi:murein endopeptidase
MAAAALVIISATAAAVAVAALADEPGGLADLRFPHAVQVQVEPQPPPVPVPPPEEPIRWRRSTPLGTHAGGRLVNGVRLPAERSTFFTWDPVLRRSPNRPWRRWGTDRLVRLLLRVARDFRAAHPDAPRMAIGDLSRPRGGNFGPQFGYIGHASHQNGLDADVYYPRADGSERAPRYASQIDRNLSQELVDRFLAAGAQVIFVGPNTGLTGPSGRVQPLIHHDNHLHVRLP